MWVAGLLLHKHHISSKTDVLSALEVCSHAESTVDYFGSRPAERHGI